VVRRWLVAVSLLGVLALWARRTWLELMKPLEDLVMQPGFPGSPLWSPRDVLQDEDGVLAWMPPPV
jgi:hypothetical protein